MLAILGNRTYRHLFAAQAIALLGTGLATVALALLAFDLAGPDAGSVLGTALAIKMLAYVSVAPFAAGVTERLPRRATLVVLDLVRAGVALALPFVTEVWQVYILIFLLQSASAAFTPTFQATIPDVLPDEKDYTRALSLSRLAYDLESLLSPLLAAALLTVLSFHDVFLGTVLGFIASAALVLSVTLSAPTPSGTQSVWTRTARGLHLFLATPRLRGLLAINMAVAAAGAMVIVNTVVIVQGSFVMSDTATALAFSAFGAGSMIAALALPNLLERLPDRAVMLSGAALLAAGLLAGLLVTDFALLVLLWGLLGLGFAAAQTPAGRLLRRSSHPEDRPALFAAQFALSHACWLVTYPLAGWLATDAGLSIAFLVLALLVAVSMAAALVLWPRQDFDVLEHDHSDLPDDDPHWSEGGEPKGRRHAHVYIVDELHREWPS